MSISLREMEIFRQVMATGSVTAASDALHVSQPAVSRILQHAEQRLGFRLFERRKKRLVPTAEATALLPKMVDVFTTIDMVRRLANDLRDGRSGILTIAAVPAFANAIVPDVIQRFRAGRPDVSIVLQHLSAPEVINRVAAGRADLGVTIGPIGNAAIEASQLCATELGCVLPPGHPLARRRRLCAADLAKEALICPNPQLPIGAQVVGAFADANVPLRIAIEASQSTIACALVRAGAGIALLDGFGLLSARAQDLSTRPFRPTIPSIARLLQPRHHPRSRMQEEFIAILHQVIRKSGFRQAAAD